jgi:hypothetical protein
MQILVHFDPEDGDDMSISKRQKNIPLLPTLKKIHII